MARPMAGIVARVRGGPRAARNPDSVRHARPADFPGRSRIPVGRGPVLPDRVNAGRGFLPVTGTPSFPRWFALPSPGRQDSSYGGAAGPLPSSSAPNRLRRTMVRAFGSLRKEHRCFGTPYVQVTAVRVETGGLRCGRARRWRGWRRQQAGQYVTRTEEFRNRSEYPSAGKGKAESCVGRSFPDFSSSARATALPRNVFAFQDRGIQNASWPGR